MSIAVYTSVYDLEPEAKQLATSLNLPFTLNKLEYDYLLILTKKYLGLIKTTGKSTPLFVDFLSGKMTYRRQQASLRNEILARALGLNHRESPKIIDATAGLARDSFILASLGFEIQLLERSPIVYTLVQDAIKRASENKHVASIVQRLQLTQADAIYWLKTCSDEIDIIYLDPMFPEREKSALVKKEMQFLQAIVGEDIDTEELLETAIACAKKRVVVKRPRLAAPITGPEPSFNIKGSSSRFDIYLIKETNGKPISVT